jgi:hypothetical protein
MGTLTNGRHETVSQEASKRRSARLSLIIPIILRGTDDKGGTFKENTWTQSVSKHGARLTTFKQIPDGSDVVIENPVYGRTARARVIRTFEKRYAEDPFTICIELAEPGNVWGVKFPPEDWQRPLPASGTKDPDKMPVGNSSPTADKVSARFASAATEKPRTLQTPAATAPEPLGSTPAKPATAHSLVKMAASAPVRGEQDEALTEKLRTLLALQEELTAVAGRLERARSDLEGTLAQATEKMQALPATLEQIRQSEALASQVEKTRTQLEDALVRATEILQTLPVSTEQFQQAALAASQAVEMVPGQAKDKAHEAITDVLRDASSQLAATQTTQLQNFASRLQALQLEALERASFEARSRFAEAHRQTLESLRKGSEDITQLHEQRLSGTLGGVLDEKLPQVLAGFQEQATGAVTQLQEKADASVAAAAERLHQARLAEMIEAEQALKNVIDGAVRSLNDALDESGRKIEERLTATESRINDSAMRAEERLAESSAAFLEKMTQDFRVRVEVFKLEMAGVLEQSKQQAEQDLAPRLQGASDLVLEETAKNLRKQTDDTLVLITEEIRTAAAGILAECTTNLSSTRTLIEATIEDAREGADQMRKDLKSAKAEVQEVGEQLRLSLEAVREEIRGTSEQTHREAQAAREEIRGATEHLQDEVSSVTRLIQQSGEQSQREAQAAKAEVLEAGKQTRQEVSEALRGAEAIREALQSATDLAHQEVQAARSEVQKAAIELRSEVESTQGALHAGLEEVRREAQTVRESVLATGKQSQQEILKAAAEAAGQLRIGTDAAMDAVQAAGELVQQEVQVARSEVQETARQLHAEVEDAQTTIRANLEQVNREAETAREGVAEAEKKARQEIGSATSEATGQMRDATEVAKGAVLAAGEQAHQEVQAARQEIHEAAGQIRAEVRTAQESIRGHLEQATEEARKARDEVIDSGRQTRHEVQAAAREAEASRGAMLAASDQALRAVVAAKKEVHDATAQLRSEALAAHGAVRADTDQLHLDTRASREAILDTGKQVRQEVQAAAFDVTGQFRKEADLAKDALKAAGASAQNELAEAAQQAEKSLRIEWEETARKISEEERTAFGTRLQHDAAGMTNAVTQELSARVRQMNEDASKTLVSSAAQASRISEQLAARLKEQAAAAETQASQGEERLAATRTLLDALQAEASQFSETFGAELGKVRAEARQAAGNEFEAVTHQIAEEQSGALRAQFHQWTQDLAKEELASTKNRLEQVTAEVLNNIYQSVGRSAVALNDLADRSCKLVDRHIQATMETYQQQFTVLASAQEVARQSAQALLEDIHSRIDQARVAFSGQAGPPAPPPPADSALVAPIPAPAAPSFQPSIDAMVQQLRDQQSALFGNLLDDLKTKLNQKP